MKKIVIDQKIIIYKVTRKKMKNISLRIKEDKILYISIPDWFPDDEIENIIISRKDFILDSIKKMDSKKYNAIQLNNNDKLLLFDKTFLICIIKSKNNTAILKDDNLIFYIEEDIFEIKKELLFEVINKESNSYFDAINKYTYSLFKNYDLPFANIKFRKMKNTLGNCRPQKKLITINKKLALMPKSCSEYVFIHEYTHFIYLDHSKKFYELLKEIMPNYKNIETIINKYIDDININNI